MYEKRTGDGIHDYECFGNAGQHYQLWWNSHELITPDKDGKMGDVVLGFDSLSAIFKKVIRISDIDPEDMATELRMEPRWMENNILWHKMIIGMHIEAR